MPRRLLSAAAAGALLLGLAACGDPTDGPVTTAPPSIDVAGPSDDGGDTSPSDGGGSETEEPTAQAPDIPPPDPADFAGMDEHTPEGAEQAFRYYIATLFWARQTGDTDLLEPLFSDNCKQCSDLSSNITNDAQHDDYWGDVNIRDSGAGHFDSTNYEIEVGYVFIVSDHIEPGSPDVVPAQEWTGVAGMEWSADAWIVDELALEETGE